jgi:glycosyltransferase involved in cell wall biosynthesis
VGTARVNNPATVLSGPALRIAMIGTRGVPAAYGGFETAVEEIGQRLVDRGHEVTVYCRTHAGPTRRAHLGMALVHLPALHLRALETLSHTALSVAHVSLHRRPDVAFVFNAANAPFLRELRRRSIPPAVHVDGLEWQRGKWGPAGRRYYRWAEEVSVRQADALISDAQGIVDYYRDEFAIPTELIRYGAKILRDTPIDRLSELGLTPGGYHLVVARFEPENHVDILVDGYVHSAASLPLVVVGSAPYAAEYTARVARLAASDPRIRLLGGVWNQDLLDQLYAHAATYLHGHSVGGTNPSLLRAMGAGTAVLAWDVVFNREVLGGSGAYFHDAASLARLIEGAEMRPRRTAEIGRDLQGRAEEGFDWDSVTAGYENLAVRLRDGYSTRGISRGRTARPTRATPESTPLHPSPATVRRSIP